MHLHHIPYVRVHISVLNGVLWDTEQVHCGMGFVRKVSLQVCQYIYRLEHDFLKKIHDESTFAISDHGLMI